MNKLDREYKTLAETLMEEKEKEQEESIIETKVEPVGITKYATCLVNIRKEPNGKIVNVLKKGESVVVTMEDCGNGWARLKDGNFIKAEFLRG